MYYETTVKQKAFYNPFSIIAPQQEDTSLSFPQFETHAIESCIIGEQKPLPILQTVTKEFKTFMIPKASGGHRTITAPTGEYKKTLKWLTQQVKHILPHNAAHAYVQGRSIQTTLQTHQVENHKWFLNMDIKDFFPSILQNDVIYNLQHQIDMYKTLYYMIPAIATTAFLDEDSSLPQGSPLSPWLSNMAMYEFDYTLTNALEEPKIVYTRYADDMLFSSNSKEDLEFIAEKLIPRKLEDIGMRVNEKKTKLRNNTGRNWQMGLMLNEHNEVTIGYKKKRQLKSEMHKLTTHKAPYCIENQPQPKPMLELAGQLEHFRNTEPEYANYLFNKYRIDIKTITRWAQKEYAKQRTA